MRPFSFHRRRSQSDLGVERLEARYLLSCTATQKGGTLTIQGSADSDQLEMHDDGEKNIELICGDQDQTFHGITQVVVNTLGGDDVVQSFLETNTDRVLIGLLVPAVLKIDLGVGNDQFDLLARPLNLSSRSASDGVSKWQISVNGGEGDDRIGLTADTSLWQQNSATSLFDVSSDLGGGHDQFTMQVLDSSQSGDTGALTENLSLNFAKIKLNAGLGDDVVDLVLQKVRLADVNVLGGAGNDQVTLKYLKYVPNASLNFFADLGAGNDQARVTGDEQVSENVGLNFAKVVLNGGDGDDTLGLALQKVRQATLQVSGGTGDDVVLMDHKGWLTDSSFNASVDLGTGDDQLIAVMGAGDETSEGVFLNFLKLKVDAGDGNDTLDLSFLKLHKQDIDILGGRGNDIVNLKLVKIEGSADSSLDVFTDLGIGDDQFNAEIGGNGTESTETENVSLNFAKINVLGGDGNDSIIAVLIGMLHSSVGVDSGRGDDVVNLKQIKGESDSADASVNLGAGNDVASFSWGVNVAAGDVNGDNFSLNFLKLKIDAGDGNDALDLSMVKLHKADVDVIGGRGNDDVSINFLKIEESKDSLFDVFTDLGLGDDQVHASVGSTGDRDYPNESLTLNFAKIKVDAGGGSDVVDLTLRNVKNCVVADQFGSARAAHKHIAGVKYEDIPANASFDGTVDLPGVGDDEVQISLGGNSEGVAPTDSFSLNFAKLKINAGDGNDVVNVVMHKVTEAHADIQGGGGDDLVGIKGESVPSDASVDVTADLGAGDDQFHAAMGGDENGDVSSDTVALNFAKIKVNANDGNDVIALALKKVREAALDLHGGRGDDLVGLKNESVPIDASLTASVDAGIGNDQVQADIGSAPNVESPTENFSLNFAKIKFDAGDGNDQLNLALQNVVENDISVFGGRGNDITSLKYEHAAVDAFLDASVDLGAGDDQWMMTTGDLATNEQSTDAVLLNFAKVQVMAGDGNDQVDMSLRQLKLADLHVSGGNGDDNLSLFVNQVEGTEVVSPPALTTGNSALSTGTGPITWVIDGGPGDDVIHLTFDGHLPVDLHVIVIGAAGHDDIVVTKHIDASSSKILAVEVSGGDQDDDLSLSIFGGESLNALMASIDGGKGTDTSFGTPNVTIRNSENGLNVLVLSLSTG